MLVRRNLQVFRLAALTGAAALLVAGCAGSGGSSGDGPSTASGDGMVNVSEGGDPVRGGVVAFGSYSEPRSLDPAVTIASATTGGGEMLNIYDSLMRLDTETQEFVPQLAAGLEHDAGFQTWTLKLRDGVVFSNGKPVNAAAVKASQERLAAKPAPEAALWNDNVVAIATPDEKTVVYTLNKAWSKFPGMLSTGPGMVVSMDSDGPDGKFTPIGAGPFALDKWAPTESMQLTARADYWAGAPYLDALRFVYTPTAEVSQDTFFSGGVDATIAREPAEIQKAMDHGVSGYMNRTAASNTTIINAAEGRPGADPRLRNAMQLAIDPAVVNERGFGDASKGASMIFAEGSRWRTQTAGPQVDLAEAKSLVAAAKADGVDTSVEFSSGPGVALQQMALAVEAQLESVGFDVQVNMRPSIGDHVRAVAADRDYDLAAWSLAFREADPYPKMFATMHSSGKQVYGMHTSPEMDALIEQLQSETEFSGQQQVVEQIQQKVNEVAPYLVYGDLADFVIWNPSLRGVVGTSNSMVLFGQAWQSA